MKWMNKWNEWISEMSEGNEYMIWMNEIVEGVDRMGLMNETDECNEWYKHDWVAFMSQPNWVKVELRLKLRLIWVWG